MQVVDFSHVEHSYNAGSILDRSMGCPWKMFVKGREDCAMYFESIFIKENLEDWEARESSLLSPCAA